MDTGKMIGMKAKGKARRNKWLHVRLHTSEHEKIMGYWKTTTCRQLSEYARAVLLRKPVIVRYRNQSADEFLAEMIRLKNELHAIGSTYKEGSHQLHTLKGIPEIKVWLLLHEKLGQALLQKTDEINRQMHQIYTAWSQE